MCPAFFYGLRYSGYIRGNYQLWKVWSGGKELSYFQSNSFVFFGLAAAYANTGKDGTVMSKKGNTTLHTREAGIHEISES